MNYPEVSFETFEYLLNAFRGTPQIHALRCEVLCIVELTLSSVQVAGETLKKLLVKFNAKCQ